MRKALVTATAVLLGATASPAIAANGADEIVSKTDRKYRLAKFRFQDKGDTVRVWNRTPRDERWIVRVRLQLYDGNRTQIGTRLCTDRVRGDGRPKTCDFDFGRDVAGMFYVLEQVDPRIGRIGRKERGSITVTPG